MLTLPEDWRILTGGAITLHLLEQISSQPLQTAFSRCFFRGSLDMMLLSWQKNQRRFLRIKKRSKQSWQIGDMIFAYLPILDNETIDYCVSIASKRLMLTAIVPHNRDAVLRQALEPSLKGWTPIIYSLADFISWRVLSLTLDRKWPRHYSLLELFLYHNIRAIEVEYNSSMLIDIWNNVRGKGR